MYWCRHDAGPVDRGSGSGTPWTQSGSSHSIQTLVAESGSSHCTQLSGRASSLPQITRRLPSEPRKHPRRSTLQTMEGTEHLGRLTHYYKLRQFLSAMIAVMSTRIETDLIKPNQTQNQTQKTMIFQMTTLDQGLVADHELQKDDK